MTPGMPRPDSVTANSPIVATQVRARPTTLSGRAAALLAGGPLDARTLMRQVCQVERLQEDAAERMAVALLGSHPEFVRIPSGQWTLLGDPATATSPVAPPGADGTAPKLLDIAFAVVDVETTGTRAGAGDRITEIAIAQVRGGAVVDVYAQLVNPERLIPPYISALTQITWDMVKDQPRFREIVPQVSARLAGHVFTAHNVAFDWRFVSEELSQGAGVQLAGPRLCTVRLARALVPTLSRRSLDHVTRYFGIEIGARHRAQGDAVATAEALLRMLRIAADEGITTWPMLEAHVASPGAKRRQGASDRRRRAFPLPVDKDSSA